MVAVGSGLFFVTSNIVQSIVGGDGRGGGGENLGFLVIFQGNVAAGSIAPGDPVQFIPNNIISQGQEYPMLGHQNTTGAGLGNFELFQQTSQVGSHQHGGTPDTPGGLRIDGAPLANRGANSGFNNNIYTFTRPAYGVVPALGLSVPQTMCILPYNLGVTMCIKT
jgi:hypothetical protein